MADVENTASEKRGTAEWLSSSASYAWHKLKQIDLNPETAFKRKRPPPASRRIMINMELPKEAYDTRGRIRRQWLFATNQVITAKYTVYNFVFKNLLEQFRRVANIFFLVLVILQFFPEFTTISPGLAMLPLLIVLFITMVKDGYEDVKRHQSDRAVNRQRTRVLTGASYKNHNKTEGKSRSLRLIWQSRKSPTPSSRPTSTISTTMSAPMSQEPPQPTSQAQSRPPSQVMTDPRWHRAITPDARPPRSTSPAAAFMHPPERSISPLPVEQIHSHYGQAFPTERRAGQGKQEPRATSPLGISLDARGQVTEDTMAGRYASSAEQGTASGHVSGPSSSQLARPPTGQYSESGEPILFYVKALYDYEASLPEEFSFTAGDIIAVTHTEPDGWWQGELLDEARRTPGANTFPSNFVVLLM